MGPVRVANNAVVVGRRAWIQQYQAGQRHTGRSFASNPSVRLPVWLAPIGRNPTRHHVGFLLQVVGVHVLIAYVARVTKRPAFKKAYADQIAHFELADEMRG